MFASDADDRDPGVVPIAKGFAVVRMWQARAELMRPQVVVVLEFPQILCVRELIDRTGAFDTFR